MGRGLLGLLLTGVVLAGLCPAASPGEDAKGQGTYQGVWITDPEAKTTQARQQREFQEAQEHAPPLRIEALLAGRELQLAPGLPGQALGLLFLLPDDEAGVRNEPPSIGSAQGRWTREGDGITVTLTKASVGLSPEAQVFKGRLRKGGLRLQEVRPDATRAPWDLIRFADGADCRCAAGKEAAPTWCWLHDRGFLASGETHCFRCVLAALRGGPCPVCRRRHLRQARLALVAGKAKEARHALAEAVAAGADGPNVRFLLGQLRTPAPATTWRLPENPQAPLLRSGRVVVRAGPKRHVHVLDGVTGHELLSFEVPPDADPPCAVSSDGRYLARCARGRVLLHDLRGDGEPRVLDFGGAKAGAVAFASAAPVVVSASSEGKVRAWSPDGAPRWTVAADVGDVRGLAADLRGERAAVVDATGDVRVVGAKAPQPLAEFAAPIPDGSLDRCVFSPLEEGLLAGRRPTWNNQLLLLVPHPFRPVRLGIDFPGPGPCRGGWFPWGGRRFVYDTQGAVRVFDPRDRRVEKLPASEGGPQTDARSLAFLEGQSCPDGDDPCSPDGMRFATSGKDGAAYVWASDTLALLARFPAASKTVSALGFTPDGRHLVVCARDGSVHVFDTARDTRPLREILRDLRKD